MSGNRSMILRTVAIIAIAFTAIALPALAQGNPFIGTWQSNLARFTFLADGRATGQQISAGTMYTSFGTYNVQGDTLSVHFTSVKPEQQCAAGVGPGGIPNTRCMPAVPMGSMRFRVQFDGPNRFVWGFDRPGPATFVRMQ